MKRMALILALSILTTCIFVSMPIKKAEASTVITRELINAALSRYTATDGRYWTYDSNVNGADTAWTGSAHYSNSTSSGTWRQYGDTAKDFFGGRQCWGFAEFVGWVVTGGTSKNDVPFRSSSWTKYYTKQSYMAAGGLEVGDIIHYHGHSVMVYEVLSDGKFKVAECLGNGGNEINVGWVEGHESHSTLAYFDSYKKGWQYALKYKGTRVMNNTPASTFEFRDIVYPHTYKINTSAGWNLSGGQLVCDQQLVSITSTIKTSSGTVISGPKTHNITGYYYTVSSLDTMDGTNNGVRFSYIKNAGNYIWILTAKDATGRELTLEMPFTAVSSGSTSTATASKTYSSESTNVDTTVGVYKFNKDDESRSGPAEANSIVTSYSKNSIVFVTGSTVNQYNNTWYQLSDGSWVWSGDVEKVTLTETSASGTYAFIHDDESRLYPYEASSLVKSYLKGTTVTVKAKVVNSYGNTWYKLSDGSYVWSGDLASTSTVTTLQFRNVKYPINYKVGSSGGYYLSDGTLESDVQLTSITSEIKDSSGTTISTITKSISGTSYAIKSLDNVNVSTSVDTGVRFSWIKSSGSYTWTLTATDANNRTLSLVMPFTASSNATTSSSKSLSYYDVSRTVTGVFIGTSLSNSAANSSNTFVGYDDATSLTLYACVEPFDASNPNLTWSSSNPKVLRFQSAENIDEGCSSAYFNFTGIGTSVITATATDGSGKKATMTVTYTASSISLWSDKTTIYIGEYLIMDPTIVPHVVSASSLTWSSSDPTVATVDSNGIVQGISTGSATITATANDGSGVKGTRSITVVSNIDNLRAAMWESPFPEDDACWDLPIRDIHVNAVFTLETYWDYLCHNIDDITTTFTVDSNSGLTKINEYGSFKATRTGTFNVYFKIYENGYIAETLTIPITVVAEDVLPYNTEVTRTISSPSHRCNMAFTPDETSNYTFILPSNVTHTIYDADWNYVTWSNTCRLTAGQKYYLSVRFSNDATTGSFTARVEKELVTGTCGDNVSWAYQNGVLTISGTGAMDDFRATNNPWQSYNSQILSVIVSEGITKIGNNSFRNLNSLASISLPSTLCEIGETAFKDCSSLSEISIPDGVTAIGTSTFSNCSSLAEIILPSGLTHIADSLLYGCGNLTSIIIPDSVQSIGWAPFASCNKLTSIIVPDGVTSLGDNAFSGCSLLNSVTIPASVVTIGSDIFAESDNVTVYCFDGSAIHTYAQNNNIPYVIIGGPCGDNVTWAYQDGVLTISGTGDMYDYGIDQAPWINYRSVIQTVIVNDGVTCIGSNAFRWYDIQNVYLPGSLKAIKYAAFCGNHNLTNLYLPEGLETIHRDAFAGTESLTSVVLPSTLKTINGMAFQNATIRTIVIPSSMTGITDNPFCFCEQLKTIVLESGSESFKLVDGVLYSIDGKKLLAYPLASAATSYAVASGTEILDSNSLYGAVNLTEVIIPEGVTTLGSNVFYRNKTIQKIYLPVSLTSIGELALSECDNLTIYCVEGSYAHTFAQANNIPFVINGGQCGDNLTWKLIGTDLTIFGTGAMYDYPGFDAPWGNRITSLTIDEGVTSIGKLAFYACDQLVSVQFPQHSLTELRQGCFQKCNGLTSFIIPDSVTTVGWTVFCWCDSLESIYVPASVTSIGDGAFSGCAVLTNVIIDTENTSYFAAEGAVFSRDGRMVSYLKANTEESYEIPDYVYSIGGYAFLSNKHLKTLTVPASVSQFGMEVFDASVVELIRCWDGSAAHTYAQTKNIPFVLLDTPLNNPDFVIPSGITEIAEESFTGIAAKRVKLPENCAGISANAFAYCPNLIGIYIPDSCTSIAKTAFSGVTNLTIYGYDGSYAEFFAGKYGFEFVAIDSN